MGRKLQDTTPIELQKKGEKVKINEKSYSHLSSFKLFHLILAFQQNRNNGKK